MEIVTGTFPWSISEPDVCWGRMDRVTSLLWPSAHSNEVRLSSVFQNLALAKLTSPNTQVALTFSYKSTVVYELILGMQGRANNDKVKKLTLLFLI